jgi:hypothetical protein
MITLTEETTTKSSHGGIKVPETTHRRWFLAEYRVSPIVHPVR